MADHIEGMPPYVKVLWSDELLVDLKIRDDECNALIVDIGKPGPDGFYTPTITVDRTDNPARVCGTCDHFVTDDEEVHCELNGLKMTHTCGCEFDPSRWLPYWTQPL